MRRLVPILVVLAALLVAVADGAPPRSVTTAIFYYPWYGTAARDGSYQHWQQNGHTPPADLASSFYPERGVYSSSDPAVVDAQMSDIARAGVREVVVSWWGKGSPEDVRLAGVVRAARAHNVEVAAHLEPYDNRTVAGTGADVAYLQTLGIRDFFVYHATDLPATDWAALNARLSDVRLFAQTNRVGFAKQGGFAGVYSYDILTSGGATFRRVCDQAHRVHLLCGPSVGPGYSARRATGDTRVKLRLNGSTYDAMWTAALRSGADMVTITSYNEWLEGTQIEPARHVAGYESYEGAWQTHGVEARSAYLARTAYWTSRFARGR